MFIGSGGRLLRLLRPVRGDGPDPQEDQERTAARLARDTQLRHRESLPIRGRNRERGREREHELDPSPQARSDGVKSLATYRGKSEPTWLFISVSRAIRNVT